MRPWVFLLMKTLLVFSLIFHSVKNAHSAHSQSLGICQKSGTVPGARGSVGSKTDQILLSFWSQHSSGRGGRSADDCTGKGKTTLEINTEKGRGGCGIMSSVKKKGLTYSEGMVRK